MEKYLKKIHFTLSKKSTIYINWFGLVWFYGISTILGYLMTNPVYTYKLEIYGL